MEREMRMIEKEGAKPEEKRIPAKFNFLLEFQNVWYYPSKTAVFFPDNFSVLEHISSISEVWGKMGTFKLHLKESKSPSCGRTERLQQMIGHANKNVAHAFFSK